MSMPVLSAFADEAKFAVKLLHNTRKAGNREAAPGKADAKL